MAPLLPLSSGSPLPLAPLLLRTAYAWDRQVFGETRSVFTIHNIGYQGVFPASAAADVGPGVGLEALHQGDLGQGRINPMRHGILYADAVTTVSPTYAQEIRQDEDRVRAIVDVTLGGDAEDRLRTEVV